MEATPSPIRVDRGIIGAPIGHATMQVSPELAFAYAMATNDPNPAYVGDGEVIAPPMLVVRPGFAALPHAAMADLGIDQFGPRRGLHGEQEMRFLAPIRPGETVVAKSRVEAIEEQPIGELVHVAVDFDTVEREPRCRSRWSLLFVDDPGRLQQTRRGTDRPEPEDPPLATDTMRVSADQAYRYAGASGDDNPTHVDQAEARRWGYATTFLQGLCTMAFACKAVVDGVAGGDPQRLGLLRVRFSAPVFPHDVLTTNVWSGDGPHDYRFRTVNQDGVQVLGKGAAELKSA